MDKTANITHHLIKQLVLEDRKNVRKHDNAETWFLQWLYEEA